MKTLNKKYLGITIAVLGMVTLALSLWLSTYSVYVVYVKGSETYAPKFVVLVFKHLDGNRNWQGKGLGYNVSSPFDIYHCVVDNGSHVFLGSWGRETTIFPNGSILQGEWSLHGFWIDIRLIVGEIVWKGEV